MSDASLVRFDAREGDLAQPSNTSTSIRFMALLLTAVEPPDLAWQARHSSVHSTRERAARDRCFVASSHDLPCRTSTMPPCRACLRIVGGGEAREEESGPSETERDEH